MLQLGIYSFWKLIFLLMSLLKITKHAILLVLKSAHDKNSESTYLACYFLIEHMKYSEFASVMCFFIIKKAIYFLRSVSSHISAVNRL